MTPLNHALRAGRSSPAAAAAAPTLLVVGGGGALGSAVLESLLAGRRFAHVRVLATRALTTAMQGLEPVVAEGFDDATAAPAGTPIADIAVIVFDRERHANGRELAFVRGLRRLIVVPPHSPAALPEALKLGLANLDEQAAAALGFEHLVFVRSARKPGPLRAEQWLQRLADGVLAQMQMMVATSNQPVRAAKAPQFVGELAAQLDSSEPGMRVAPPQLAWQAAQMRDAAGLVQAWLARRELPEVTAPRRRM